MFLHEMADCVHMHACSTCHNAAHQMVFTQEGSAAEGGPASKEGARTIRSSALRFWASVLERFPDNTDYNCFWHRFLTAVQPQMPRMAVEVSLAVSFCFPS